METINAISLAMGASWASGLNLYAAILALGVMHNAGSIDLPPDLQLLGNPIVLLAAGFMYLVEFFADKIPGVDSAWDGIHTFVRIPAGAVLAAQALGPVDPAVSLTAGLLGGTLAGTSHAIKASGRMLINTSPEPVSNWTASVAEDVVVFGGLWAAVNHPVAFLIGLAAFVALVIWLLPKIVRLLGRVLRRIVAFFRGESPERERRDSDDRDRGHYEPRDYREPAPRGERFAYPAPAPEPARLRGPARREAHRGYRGS